MHSPSRCPARSWPLVTLLGAALFTGAAAITLPAVAATANLSSTWSANLGGGTIVSTAGIIALGAGGGTCSSTAGGTGAQVVGAIALTGTDTLIGYPGGVGSACGTPTGGAGGVDSDPNADYRGGNGGLGFNGDNLAESGAGGGAATTVYRNATTQVAFAGGGGGAGGDAVATGNNQVQGGTGGAGSGGAGGNGAAGGGGGAFGSATGGNGGAGGTWPWTRGKDASNATCSSGPCGGPAGSGAGSFSSIAAGDGAAVNNQAAGGGGGGGGASAGTGLTLPAYSAASSSAAGSASVTYIDITAGSVDNAVIGGTYGGTSFAADGGWTGLTWTLDGACSGCSLPAGLTLDASTGAISGSVTAPAGGYTFDVVAAGNPASGPLSTFQLQTRRSLSMSVAVAPPPAAAQAIPTLSEWSLTLLAGCMGLSAWLRLRRQRLFA